MPNFSFSKLLIVESLPPGQFHTGSHLASILAPAIAAADSRLSIHLEQIRTAQEFRDLLALTLRWVVETGELPLLHIECHGNDDGLVFSDSSTMYWKELYPLLRDINVGTRMRLLVCIAACFGAYLGERLDLTDRAAFVALLSPSTGIFPDDLFRAYFAFYSSMLTTRNGDQALAQMGAANPASPPLAFVDATYFFKIAYKRYLQKLCTPTEYLNRAVSIQAQQRLQGIPVADVNDILMHLQQSEPDYFSQFRDTYFMRDLFPENSARFPVVRSDVIP